MKPSWQCGDIEGQLHDWQSTNRWGKHVDLGTSMKQVAYVRCARCEQNGFRSGRYGNNVSTWAKGSGDTA